MQLIIKQNIYNNLLLVENYKNSGDHHGRDHMVVGFITTYAISAYQYYDLYLPMSYNI